MKGKKFSLSTWAASLAGALMGAGITYFGMAALGDSSVNRMLWSGCFFLFLFLGGFAGMQLSFCFSRRYQVERPRHWLIAMLLAAVILFGLGAGGQLLFMYSRETISIPAQVDMVLLLDASGSMNTAYYSGPRTDAACQFVDSLNGDHRLQVISFAAKVLDRSALTVTDDAGKEALKKMIRSIDSTGTTDFNKPLEEAMRTLQDQGRPDSRKAVILLTDGFASLSDEVIRAYTASDIKVFSIRIGSLTGANPEVRAMAEALTKFAQDTGGFDTQLIPQGITVDAADMLDAFQKAFQATSETRSNLSSDLLVYSEETTLWQFLVRTVTLMLCAAVFAYGYFGRLNLRSLLLHCGVGMVLSVLISVLVGIGQVLSEILLCLGMGTAYVSFNLGIGDEIDV